MDQGFTKKLSSNCIANVDLKYRLRSVNNEGDNSSSCDIEHTEFRIWKAAARDYSPARSTHTTAAPNFLLSRTNTGSTLGIFNWPATPAV
jgi:hypothetical protein